MKNSVPQSLKNPIYSIFALYEEIPLKEYGCVTWH